jgi:uncharacterized repeat protein (TIGR03847 family)
MSRQILDYQAPDRFVVGTVGMPGERTFFLQVRQGNAITSVALEKAQVAVLAERVDQLLDEAAERSPDAMIPSSATADHGDASPLDAPIVEEFRVGAMALGWDEANLRVVIEAHAVSEEGDEVPDIGDDDADGPSTLRVWIDAAYARAFAERARQVVSAGRPACPFCSQPLDPDGHICPRANGYRRRS